jgi:probable F420-dependent oxidoreductase
MNLGRVGVFLGSLALFSATDERQAVQELEGLGYGALWFGEGLGTREALAHAATLLAWTNRIVIGTGIASVYARDSLAMANGARTLADAYPGRFVLGLGISHAPFVAERGHTYARQPIVTMRAYLDGMDAAQYGAPKPENPAPIVLAALGPRMLQLARERADGAHPYFTTPEHTAFARGILGPGRLLAPEQAILLENDAWEARRLAHEHMSFPLQLVNYTNNLLRLGFTNADFLGGGSQRLTDAIIAWGTVENITARVRAHIDAGADHVCVQALGRTPVAALRTLAPSLLQL